MVLFRLPLLAICREDSDPRYIKGNATEVKLRTFDTKVSIELETGAPHLIMFDLSKPCLVLSLTLHMMTQPTSQAYLIASWLGTIGTFW